MVKFTLNSVNYFTNRIWKYERKNGKKNLPKEKQICRCKGVYCIIFFFWKQALKNLIFPIVPSCEPGQLFHYHCCSLLNR